MPPDYRSSEDRCTRCAAVLRDGAELSPSTGETVCGDCWKREGLAAAEAVLEAARPTRAATERLAREKP